MNVTTATTESARPTETVSATCAVLLAAIWLYSATRKALDLQGFVAVIKTHGLLSQAAIPWLGAVPAAELLLAVWLGVFGDLSRFRRIGTIGVCASIGALFVLTIYVVLVPGSQLALVGCGCHGPWHPPAGMASERRLTAIAGNIAITALHIPVIWNHRATKAAGDAQVAGRTAP